MEVLGLFILAINVVLLFILSNRINSYAAIQKQYRAIEKNMQAMVQENTRLVEVILEELENKMKEIKESKLTQNRYYAMKNEQDVKREVPQKAEATVKTYLLTQIMELREQGLSVQEIAEKLSIPQGEIVLKLNLQEKSINRVIQ